MKNQQNFPFLNYLKQLNFGWILIILSIMVLPVMGCAQREEAKAKSKEIRVAAEKSLEDIRIKPEKRDTLMIADTPWFGQKAIPFQNGTPLPKHVEQEDSLVITFDKPLTLMEVASLLQGTTGIRISVETGGAEIQDPALQPRFLPADGMEVSGGRILWQGSLSNLLNQLSDRFDAQWSYNGTSIKLSQHIVRTFMLHSLAGSTEVGGSVKTGATGSEGGLPQQSVDTSTTLSIWEEIEAAITSITDSRARVSLSPTTGTITIAGAPSVVNDVEKYLKMQNSLRLRRVAIETQVLSVTLSDEYDYNFDLDIIIKEAFNNQPLVFSSVNDPLTNGRDVATGLLREIPAGLGDRGTVQAVVNALDAIAEEVSVIHSGSVVTLSDQPAPLQVATKRAYVARVSGSSSDTTSSVSLEPGTIDIGLSMNVLPRVIQRDKVMLRLAIGITDLVELREFTSGDTSIQLPEVDTTGFLQNAILSDGETLVLAGFERKSANDLESGTGVPWNMALGGQKAFGHGREIRVLLITADVLPEDPIEVISQ